VTAARQRYPADPAIARSARGFVAERLSRLALAELADEAALLAGELVTNAILHARTGFEVRVTAVEDGARVEVLDDSPALPMAGTLAAGALSGRGLMLVQTLSTRWGAHPGPAPGKTVWFELFLRSEGAGDDVDELLALWDPPPRPSPPRGRELAEVVIPDLPVQRLLAAKAHMEDLLRELQLILLNPATEAGVPSYPAPVLELARRLDAAARDFAEGRRQVKGQALAAAARGREVVTLRLHLPRPAGEAAARYRAAVDEATALAGSGALLATAASLQDHTSIRTRYLDAVVDQLSRGD
jgi:anti-sigma regulatory factor (Ser/Thr protein kinase)